MEYFLFWKINNVNKTRGNAGMIDTYEKFFKKVAAAWPIDN